MAHALTRYQAMYEATTLAPPRAHKGLDIAAARLQMKLRTRSGTLARLRSRARQIDTQAPTLRDISDAALDARIAQLRETFRRGRQTTDHTLAALAAVREVARRLTGEEAYPVQLMGALALASGRVIEMRTGEGKTLTGSLAAVLLAWQHRHVHVLTVNDYLATRDAKSRAPIYQRCGCAVGAIHQQLEQHERARLYALPIVYGTPKQIAADFLRDTLRMGTHRTAWSGRALLQRTSASGAHAGPIVPGLHAAIVDEADAVLIDEGVVPLIIAQARHEDDAADFYKDACTIARKLDLGPDYTIDYLRKRATLTGRGKHRLTQLFADQADPIWRARRRAEELVRQALIAQHCYIKGHQYEIVDGRVVIVDEYTGRFLADRSWEHGLHQAVEAKEHVDITADRETLARISFQRFFRMYPVLAGMTGTAADARAEIERIYDRPVSVIPTNKPIARTQLPTRVFTSSNARWNAVAESIESFHRQGRPALVGTRSIDASQHIAQLLTQRNLPHNVLNANFDADEAELIAGAGRAGAITVATNMAGRGTDILLDDEARTAGGLHVILTEMHTARRIDQQFIGRAGRQGDPGSAQIFVSFDDELLRLYPSPLPLVRSFPQQLISKANPNELAGSLRRLAVRAAHTAQHRAQTRARRQRTEVLRQDDWIDTHLPGR